MISSMDSIQRSDIAKRLGAEAKAYQERVRAITAHAFGVEEPPVALTHMIDFQRQSNPMIHRFKLQASTEAVIDDTILLSSDSEEVQQFLRNVKDRSDKLVSVMRQYVEDRFALEMAIPEVAEFLAESVPSDLDYFEAINSLSPKIISAINKQLYFNLTTEVLGCNEGALEIPSSPATQNPDVVSRFLDEWRKTNGSLSR